MSKVIDYYFTVISPWTYLGTGRLGDLVARTGATLNCYPVDYGRIFPETGGVPLPKRAPARQAYRLVELRRWRDYLGVPINIQPRHFPVNDLLARLCIACVRERGGDAFGLSVALGRAIWVEERDLGDPGTVAAVLSEQGFDGGAIVEAAQGDDVRAIHDRDTEAALACGVFGAPTYVLEGELFWGQDRLDFLARAVEAEG